MILLCCMLAFRGLIKENVLSFLIKTFWVLFRNALLRLLLSMMYAGC